MSGGLGWPLLLEGQQPPGDPLAVLQSGCSEAERSTALRQLADAAAGGSPTALNQYAAGLFTVGRVDEAERVWRALQTERPGTAVAGLNLATCHLAAGRLDECARVLRDCRDGAPAGSRQRELAEWRIAELDEARNGAARQTRLLELRAAALRERVRLGLAGLEDLKQLARVLYALTQVPDSGVTGRDLLDAARRAREAAPGDPEVLEILVLGQLVAGSDVEFAAALRELERFAPHSRVLDMARRTRTDTGFQDEVRARSARMREVARRAFAGDRVAEDELRLESQKFPENFQYRVDLLFAVYNRGDREEARRLADGLAAEPSADHYVHFHIAQFYWFLGERERSRRHFALAYETAVTEGDREDVREAVRTVGAGDPEELGLR
ncbi:hypothetical protein ABZV31_32380 [Streptomyces sp. NPDC005202]|uniref:hypothetical protein n=1 Tax=Streptomyces sp. NPDC005202 TaxID=3157021 RepID=UPI0033A85D4F